MYSRDDLVDTSVVCAFLLVLIFVVANMRVTKAQAQQPYNAFKIPYGCLYVVYNGPSGGVAAVTAPSVNGKCE